jgi:L-malate glycosyltransferase
MHVVIVANGEVFGGAERQILTLATGLRDNHGVTLITLCEGELAAKARAAGLSTVSLGTQSALDLTALRKLRDELSRDPQALIHIHGYRAAVYCWLALRGQRRRVVKTEHGAPELPRAGFLSRTKYRGFMFADRIATRALKAYCVYVTQDLTRFFADWGITRSRVIHNGLATDELANAAGASPYTPGSIPLVMVGRVEHVKAIDIAIQAVARLAGLKGAQRFELHIVGSGVELDRLRTLAQASGVADRVVFHGHQRNPYPFIAHAAALLMCSRHEGLPYTVLESLYFGTPVIASDVGGLREVLTDGKTALLVPPEKADLLADAILRLERSPELRQTLSREGAALVAEKFTAEKMARDYAALYARV